MAAGDGSGEIGDSVTEEGAAAGGKLLHADTHTIMARTNRIRKLDLVIILLSINANRSHVKLASRQMRLASSYRLNL